MTSSTIRLVFCSLSLIASIGCASADPNPPDPGAPDSTERHALGKADSGGSCVDHCGGKSKGSCWCDDLCSTYGDCCSDIGSACGAQDGPVIVFGSDYSENVSAELVRGASVKLDYDADRLTDCRGTQGGYPQWAISGFYRIDGGPIGTVAVAGNMAPQKPDLPSITLDRRGDLEIWFQNTNRWGCVAYDSDYGQNYHFDVK